MSGTFSAYCCVSAASDTTFSSSRSHCTAAPPTKILPSRAYSTWFPQLAAIVVTSPFLLSTISLPVFISRKQPVP